MGNTGFRIKTPPLCRRTARCLKKTICGLIIHNLRTGIKGNFDIIRLICSRRNAAVHTVRPPGQ